MINDDIYINDDGLFDVAGEVGSFHVKSFSGKVVDVKFIRFFSQHVSGPVRGFDNFVCMSGNGVIPTDGINKQGFTCGECGKSITDCKMLGLLTIEYGPDKQNFDIKIMGDSVQEFMNYVSTVSGPLQSQITKFSVVKSKEGSLCKHSIRFKKAK